MSEITTYEKTKDSGIEWIGSVPSHWRVHTLYQLVTQVKERNSNLQEKNLLSLSYGKIKRKDIDSPDGLLPASFDGYNIIEDGDIVLRLTDLQNDHTSLRVGLATERGIITSAYTTLRPIDTSNSKYLFYLLHAFDLKKGFYGMGSGVRQGLNYAEVKELRIVLPSQDEQDAIASFLDNQCGQIDSIIEEAKSSVEEYKKWRSILIFEAITKGIDPNIEKKDSGIKQIGQIPIYWDCCSLKLLTTKIGSGKTPSGGAEVYTNSGIMFLRSQNIYDSGLILQDVSFISSEIDEEMKNTRVHYNDVLLNITGGSIGRCCVYNLKDVPANVNQHVCIIRTQSEKLLPQFLRYFWNASAGTMSVGLYQTGGNRPGLNFEQIGSTKVPVCSLQEQQRIVEYLDKITAEIDKLIIEKQNLTTDMENYKRSLIYEVVTGKRKVV